MSKNMSSTNSRGREQAKRTEVLEIANDILAENLLHTLTFRHLFKVLERCKIVNCLLICSGRLAKYYENKHI